MIQKDSIDYILELHKAVLYLHGLALIGFGVVVLLLLAILINVIDLKNKIKS